MEGNKFVNQGSTVIVRKSTSHDKVLEDGLMAHRVGAQKKRACLWSEPVDYLEAHGTYQLP